MDSRLYWIWLQQALGYGNPAVSHLFSHFDSPQEVYDADEEAYRKAGLPRTLIKRLCDKSLSAARDVLERTVSAGDWLLTPSDEWYPELLRGIFSPPLVLYGRGTLPPLTDRPIIGMVGTRSMTNYGRRVSALIANGLAAGGAVLVSGCADGGDEAALNAALDGGGRVISVLPTGLDGKYPRATLYLRRRILECHGALVTEYPYGTGVSKGTFHIRNRIISGISHGVCVVEAPEQSGALITATHATEQGRDVFAVPGDITSPTSAGTNRLIRNGAKLVRHAEDILEEYAGRFPDILRANILAALPTAMPKKLRVAQQKPSTPPPPMSDTARAVYAVVKDTPQPVDEIAAAADVSMSAAFGALTELELTGRVASAAGQQYYRT